MRNYIRSIAVLTLLILGSITGFAQEVKPLNEVKDLQTIKESAKGKILLLNFWASWCGPCVHEFPDLVKLYNNYKDKDFVLIFVSLDDVQDIDAKVVPFLNKQNVDFVTYYNNLKKPEDLIDYVDKDWQGAIPSTYIYDTEGKIKKSYLGSRSYEDFESEINKYMHAPKWN